MDYTVVVFFQLFVKKEKEKFKDDNNNYRNIQEMVLINTVTT